MRILYIFSLYLALPFILLRLLLRARKNPAYRLRWRERLGQLPEHFKPDGIWLHAVSVGESLAVLPLVRQLQQDYPQSVITVTTTTLTGSSIIQKNLGNTVQHAYLPYDLPYFVKHFLKKLKPKILILMETELWPTLLYYCRRQNIPIILANARLSVKSATGYKKIGKITHDMLQQLTLVAAQTQEDRQRFIELGLDANKLQVTGNIKFDLTLAKNLPEQAQQLRAQWDLQRPVWVAASTHAEEEQAIITTHQQIQKQLPNALLIWVPRHPERFDIVATLCQQHHFSITRRSEKRAATTATEIFLGDTIGELLLFYAAADVAFVGGSFIEKGGHNLLEPAAIGLPILTGPSLFNFAAISQTLIQANAAHVVQNSDELAQRIITLLQDPQTRQRMGANGQHIVAQNRGSLAKQLRLIKLLIE